MDSMLPIQERDKADADVHQPSMSAVGSEFHYKIKALHAFGFSGAKEKGFQLVCIDDDTIVYPIGCKLAVYCVSSNHMRFVTLGSSTERIVSIVASPSRHLLGVCQKIKGATSQVLQSVAEKAASVQPKVSIVSLKKLRKVQTLVPYPEGTVVGDFQICGFSKDEAIVVAASNSQEAYLVCWHRKSGHVIASTFVQLEIIGVSINPENNNEIATHGPTHFKLWVPAKQGSFKDLGVQGLQGKSLPKVTFTDHCWLHNGILVVATVEGTIFVLKEGTLHMKVAETEHLLCLCSTNQGCLSASVTGLLSVHNCLEDTDAPEGKGKLNLEWKTTVLQRGYMPITTIAVSAKFKNILYVVEGEEVRRLCVDDIDDTTILIEDKLPVSSKLCAFNFGAVNGMDICEQHQILATCTSDKVVRLWNYTRMMLDISHTCELEPLSVALHPWGYEVLVGLPRNVSIYRIMATKLEHYRDVPIVHCHIIRFSPSGHLVAFASGRNIHIFSSFTWKFSAMLKGHLSLVTSISWSADSIYLATAGNDGAIYIWFMDGCHRVQECVRKGSNYTSILFDPSRESVVSCGPQLPLRVMDTDKKQARYILETFSNTDYLDKKTMMPGSSLSVGGRRKSEIVEAGEGWVHHVFRANIVFELPLEQPVVHVAGLFRKGLILTSTNDGELRASIYPLAKDRKSPVDGMSLHSGEITGLIVDEKKNLIFTCSAQGTIHISTLVQVASSPEVETSVLHSGSSEAMDGITQECLLVHRTEYYDTKKEEQELRMTLEKERRDAPYKQRVLEQEWVSKIKAREERLRAREDAYKEETKVLERQHTKAQKEMETTMKELLAESQMNLRQLEDSFEQKTCDEIRRAEQFKMDHILERELWKREMEDQRTKHLSEVEVVKQQFEVIKRDSENLVQDARRKCDEEIRHYKGFMEEDLLINEEELEENFMQLKEYIEVKEKRVETVRDDMLVERRNNTKLQQQIISLQEMCKEQDVTITDLEAEVTKLQDMIIQAEQRTRAVDEIFLLTDVHIKSLLSQHKEQKTMALVRDMQIKELRRKEEPLEKELQTLRTDMHQMERLQIQNTRTQANKDEFAKGLRGRIQMQENQIHRLTLTLLEKERYMDVFTEALCRIVCDHDVLEWPELTKDLFNAYVNDDTQSAVKSGLESRTEMMHQRQTLENYLAVLKDAAVRSETRHFKETRHYMQDNLRLLGDFADANRNVRRLAFVVQHLQGEVSYYRAIAAKNTRDATTKFRVQFSRLSQAANFGGQAIEPNPPRTPSSLSRQTVSPSPASNPSRSSSPDLSFPMSRSSSPQLTSTRGSTPQANYSRLAAPSLLPLSRVPSPLPATAANLPEPSPIRLIEEPRIIQSPSRMSDVTSTTGTQSPEPSPSRRSDSPAVSFADVKTIDKPQDAPKQGEVKEALASPQNSGLDRRRGSSPVGEILKNLYMVAPNQTKRQSASFRRGHSVPGLIPARKSIEAPRPKSISREPRPKSVSGESTQALLMRLRQAKMELKLKQEEIRQLHIALSMVGNENREGHPRDLDAAAEFSLSEPVLTANIPDQGGSTEGIAGRRPFVMRDPGLQVTKRNSTPATNRTESVSGREDSEFSAWSSPNSDMLAARPLDSLTREAEVSESSVPSRRPSASTGELIRRSSISPIDPSSRRSSVSPMPSTGRRASFPPIESSTQQVTRQPVAPLPADNTSSSPPQAPVPTRGDDALARQPSISASTPAQPSTSTNRSKVATAGAGAGGRSSPENPSNSPSPTVDRSGNSAALGSTSVAKAGDSTSPESTGRPGNSQLPPGIQDKPNVDPTPKPIRATPSISSTQVGGAGNKTSLSPADAATRKEVTSKRMSGGSATLDPAGKPGGSATQPAETRKSGVTISPAGFPIDLTRTFKKSIASASENKPIPDTKESK